jgi:putative ABC transport system permease protein
MGLEGGRELTEEQRKRKPLTVEDAAAIGQLPSVAAVSPILMPSGLPPVIRFRSNEVRTPNVRGVRSDYAKIRDIIVAEGRFFTDTEDSHRLAVCVIGHNIADKLFAGYEPLGNQIIIGIKTFTVIGILEQAKAGIFSSGGMNPDNLIFIPFDVMRVIYPAQEEIFITAQAAAGKLDQMVDDITALLRHRRKVHASQPDSFSLNTPSGLISSFNDLLKIIALIVIPITSIALLVGGIGVMNIMLVSVTERTREIGIRRAVGARRRDIVWQFMLEAVTLTGLGGVIGIGFGLLISLLARFLFPTYVPVTFIAIGFGVSVTVGLIFGIYPAVKAARLDPIEALRYE